MSRTRKFGRILQKDPRDAKYRLKKIASQRKRRVWKDDYVFLDQGQKESCVGHAWSHWLLNYPLRQYLDPDFIYDVARFYDEYKGENFEGTSVRAGAKVLSLAGFVAEYRWATTLDLVVNTLLERGPMVVGTNWFEGMSNPDKMGLMSLDGQDQGGHAYLITGVDTVTKLLRMKNSWGKSWGLSGHGYIPFEMFGKLLAADGEACIAFESDPFKKLKRNRSA